MCKRWKNQIENSSNKLSRPATASILVRSEYDRLRRKEFAEVIELV